MFKSLTSQLWFVVIFTGLCAWTQNAHATNGLKSAYLGSSVWEENLSAQQINDQVKAHFAEVLVQLKTNSASSLLTALTRAETSSVKPWSKEERRAALIYLAHNRQLQIKRLRDYMNRGLFPLNEGQSPDAVPIFVDRHKTHCAVGHLMHVDGKDAEVAQIVNANNLVRIRSVEGGDMVRWIRTSGLTQEEAAMIQPAYPIFGLTPFQSFLDPSVEVQSSSNGLTLSDVSVRGARFTAALPPSFASDPTAIDAIFAQGLVALDNNNVVTSGFRNARGALFGEAGCGSNAAGGDPGFTPANLDTWLYLGPDDAQFSGLIGGVTASGNVGIVEIEYQIRAPAGNPFTRVAVTSTAQSFGFEVPLNFASSFSEQNAALIVSEIYRGNSNDLLAAPRLFVAGDTQLFVRTNLEGSEITSLSEDFLRIRNYGLVVGDGGIHRIFNEFETVTPSLLKGDVNLDGRVNFADIPPFISLLNYGVYFQAEADFDCNRIVDFQDIPQFIAALQAQ